MKFKIFITRYVRAEILAGFVNGLFLLFIAFFIFSEAVEVRSSLTCSFIIVNNLLLLYTSYSCVNYLLFSEERRKNSHPFFQCSVNRVGSIVAVDLHENHIISHCI